VRSPRPGSNEGVNTQQEEGSIWSSGARCLIYVSWLRSFAAVWTRRRSSSLQMQRARQKSRGSRPMRITAERSTTRYGQALRPGKYLPMHTMSAKHLSTAVPGTRGSDCRQARSLQNRSNSATDLLAVAMHFKRNLERFRSDLACLLSDLPSKEIEQRAILSFSEWTENKQRTFRLLSSLHLCLFDSSAQEWRQANAQFWSRVLRNL